MYGREKNNLGGSSRTRRMAKTCNNTEEWLEFKSKMLLAE